MLTETQNIQHSAQNKGTSQNTGVLSFDRQYQGRPCGPAHHKGKGMKSKQNSCLCASQEAPHSWIRKPSQTHGCLIILRLLKILRVELKSNFRKTMNIYQVLF